MKRERITVSSPTLGGWPVRRGMHMWIGGPENGLWKVVGLSRDKLRWLVERRDADDA